jgi:trehalose 6-phosphate synthase/phosphatase
VIEAAIRRLRAARHLVLLLDYDGTLVPLMSTPDLALPDPPLRALLQRLAGRPDTEVHVVSGRRRDTLERWLGDLAIGLHAEHGVWSRRAGDRRWTALELPETGWRAAVLPILEDFTARTPGSLVEEKTFGVAWHYRMADPDLGAAHARDLHFHLATVLGDEPVEVLTGAKVIEVRPHGVNKGRLVAPILAAAPPGSTVAAMGDDVTDEDLFAALPPEALAIRVGRGPTPAPLRVADVGAARALLLSLLEPAAAR